MPRGSSSSSTRRSSRRSSRSREQCRERLRRPYGDFAPGVTKQATRPVSATSLGLAGTAPGLVLKAPTGCVVVVLPGPPGELRRLWPNALDSEPMRELLQRTRPPGRRVLRLFGVSESAVARALEESGGDGDGVEATICAREFEIHIDLVVEPGAEERADVLEAALAERLEQWLFSRDERRVEELVLSLARRARPAARHGRVLHGRHGRRAAHRRAGLQRELRRGRGLVCGRGEALGAGRSRGAARRSTAPSPPRLRPRWPRERAGGSVRTWPSR